MKSSRYYFHMKTKIYADFQICISVPFNIKIFAKSNKIELSEEFIAIWREEQASEMSCPLCIEIKMKKTKV